MSRLPRRGLVSTAALVLAVVVACGGSDEARPLPGSLEVRFGQGGGVTGRWRGYTVTPDGMLLEWSPPVAVSDTVDVGTVNERGRQAMWRAIERSGILDEAQDERANMTRTIQVVVDGTTHEAWWPLSIRGGSELDPLYEELHALVETHRVEKQSSPRVVGGADF